MEFVHRVFFCVFFAIVLYAGLGFETRMHTDSFLYLLGRAVTDAAYREILFEDAEKALAGYALTDHDVIALRGVPRELLDAFAGALTAQFVAIANQKRGQP